MQFKSPGGDLVWVTPLLFLAGCFMAYFHVREGAIGFAIFYGVLGLLCMLTWCDAK